MPLTPVPAVLAALLVTLLAPGLAAADAVTTSFTLRPPGDIVVPVTIDGQGPFRMLLDTGASRSAVSAAVADRLSSRVVGETRMVTPAGDGHRTLVLLKGVVVGAIGPQSVVGLRLEPGDLGEPDIDGLVGLDLLGRAPFTIDYAAGTLAWRLPSDPDPPGTRVPVELVDGRLTARVACAGRDLRLIVDSGADRLVLFARTGARSSMPRVIGSGALRSTSGRRPVAAVRVTTLDVGGMALGGQTAALVEGAHEALEDGLLPIHLFSRVTLNAPAGYIVVQE